MSVLILGGDSHTREVSLSSLSVSALVRVRARVLNRQSMS